MKQTQRLSLKNSQRLTVMGRMRMADWIQMPEREFAHEVEKLEKDPLFQKLYFGDGRIPGAVRRQRWPGGKLAGSFYEIDSALKITLIADVLSQPGNRYGLGLLLF